MYYFLFNLLLLHVNNLENSTFPVFNFFLNTEIVVLIFLYAWPRKQGVLFTIIICVLFYCFCYSMIVSIVDSVRYLWKMFRETRVYTNKGAISKNDTLNLKILLKVLKFKGKHFKILTLNLTRDINSSLRAILCRYSWVFKMKIYTVEYS